MAPVDQRLAVAIVAAVAVVATVVAIRRRLAVVTVRGQSMAPRYVDGNRVLVLRGSHRVRHGVVVVFVPPRDAWFRYLSGGDPALDPVLQADPAPQMKRVAALPGDEVPASVRTAARTALDGRVPPGHLVVFGDAASSADSRSWGYLPVTNVIGTVLGDLPPPRTDQQTGARGPIPSQRS